MNTCTDRGGRCLLRMTRRQGPKPRVQSVTCVEDDDRLLSASMVSLELKTWIPKSVCLTQRTNMSNPDTSSVLAQQEKEFAKEMDNLSLGQAGTSAGGEVVKKYDKSSFFDEISCDILDRAQGVCVSDTSSSVTAGSGRYVFQLGLRRSVPEVDGIHGGVIRKIAANVDALACGHDSLVMVT